MLQAEALNILKTGANVFLTGEPGSGKTHTVNAYVSWLRSHGIEPSITASTGIAATHIRGMTIHSWSGIGIAHELTPELVDRVASKEHVARRIQKTRVLIIDEVSMLSGEVLEIIDAVAREVRHNQLPFGGMQVVLVGDFFQLPPVSNSKQETTFAFESSVWGKLNPIVCYLSEQFRQDDPAFLTILGAIRAGTHDQSHISTLLTRESEEVTENTPILFTHNEDVDRINDAKLEELPGNVHIYGMKDEGAPPLIEALKRGCLSPETLALKEGAVVMATKNNPAGGYVNGTLGIVAGFERGTNYPIVETREGTDIIFQPMEWAVEEGGKVRAKITQIPLRLAWAITVHKSQGMSMDAAAIDLSRAFEYGQGYVALSRVRCLEGICLLGWSENALVMHPKVTKKDGEFRESSEDARLAFDLLEKEGERAVLEKNFILASGGVLEAGNAPAPAARVSTYDATLALLKEGKMVGLIAKERGLTPATVADHVEKLVASGRIAIGEARKAIPERLLKALPEIEAMFIKIGRDKLAPVHARLKGKYSYDDLKLARAVIAD